MEETKNQPTTTALTENKPSPVSSLWSKLTTPIMISVWKGLGVVLLLTLLGLGIWHFVNKNGSQVSAILQDYKTQLLESHEDIEELGHLVDQERTARERLEADFNTRITEIDQRYSEAIEEIRRTRTRRQREIVERPTELGARFDETFGIGATP